MGGAPVIAEKGPHPYDCYVARSGDHWANGETLSEALENLKKLTQEEEKNEKNDFGCGAAGRDGDLGP